MVKLSRKLKRSRLVNQKKSAKKQIKKIEESLNLVPDSCSFCDKGFNIKNDCTTWMVEAFTDRMNLMCPQCFERRKNDIS